MATTSTNYGTGRRKTSTARVYLRPGNGNITASLPRRAGNGSNGEAGDGRTDLRRQAIGESPPGSLPKHAGKRRRKR
jgi:hypothetical protein